MCLCRSSQSCSRAADLRRRERRRKDVEGMVGKDDQEDGHQVRSDVLQSHQVAQSTPSSPPAVQEAGSLSGRRYGFAPAGIADSR